MQLSAVSARVHALSGARVPLDRVEHGRQLGVGLDLREELTQKGAFVWTEIGEPERNVSKRASGQERWMGERVSE